MITLITIKVLVSVAIVLALSMIAERVSPKVAGMLSGYPLGTAIALFFIGYEISPDFAAESAVYTLAGFASTLMLSTGYLLGCKPVTDQPSEAEPQAIPVDKTQPAASWQIIGLASLCGITLFLISGYLIQMLSLNLLTAACLPAVAILLCLWGYRHIPETQVTRKAPMSFMVLIFRALVAAGIVLVITGLAHVVPASIAGILAAFPVSMFPFLVLMHRSYGSGKAATIIKHYPTGLGSLMVYATSVAWCYPSSGLLWGTVLSFALATVYLMIAPPWIDRLRSLWQR
ncbi:hypothetical protein [Oceanospirillum sediminis]|uniref:Uncharacterized protein n=1 Tax=Oceanospirillum sediminis TaxID=2760088 RepID=A0A839IN68_9GAMM|nr:hypothetical protein [Oceanospirillum sediminis]MBB1486903.1 hypothetical protein [Oceanospirillum sediminis]